MNEWFLPGDVVDVDSGPRKSGEGGAHDGERGAVLGRKLNGDGGADVVETLKWILHILLE